jgi:hypothetical protein
VKAAPGLIRNGSAYPCLGALLPLVEVAPSLHQERDGLRGRVALSYAFSASFKAFAGENDTLRAAGISMVSPVLGFRP